MLSCTKIVSTEECLKICLWCLQAEELEAAARVAFTALTAPLVWSMHPGHGENQLETSAAGILRTIAPNILQLDTDILVFAFTKHLKRSGGHNDKLASLVCSALNNMLCRSRFTPHTDQQHAFQQIRSAVHKHKAVGALTQVLHLALERPGGVGFLDAFQDDKLVSVMACLNNIAHMGTQAFCPTATADSTSNFQKFISVTQALNEAMPPEPSDEWLSQMQMALKICTSLNSSNRRNAT